MLLGAWLRICNQQITGSKFTTGQNEVKRVVSRDIYFLFSGKRKHTKFICRETMFSRTKFQKVL